MRASLVSDRRGRDPVHQPALGVPVGEDALRGVRPAGCVGWRLGARRPQSAGAAAHRSIETVQSQNEPAGCAMSEAATRQSCVLGIDIGKGGWSCTQIDLGDAGRMLRPEGLCLPLSAGAHAARRLP
jgi:hypothetical protein